VARDVPRARASLSVPSAAGHSGLGGSMAAEGRAYAENKLLCKAASGPKARLGRSARKRPGWMRARPRPFTRGAVVPGWRRR